MSHPAPAGPRDEPAPSRLERAAGTVFGWALMLYPRRFREQFADEMREVLLQALGEAAQEGILPVAKILGRELAEWPLALLLEHCYQRRRRSMALLQTNTLREIQVARWVARITSLLVGGTVLLLFLLNEDMRQDPTPPALILGLLSLLVLAAWRWERVAGTLTLLAAPLFFIAAVLELGRMDGLMTPFWALLLIDGAITLSYLIMGWLYVSIARHAAVVGDRTLARPSRTRLWVILAVGLLGLVAIAAFAVPMVVPVQQQMEEPAGRFDPIGRDTLVDRLAAAGADVALGGGPVGHPFFSVPGYELVVDGEIVQAFEYADISAATVDAAALDAAERSTPGASGSGGAPRCYQVRNVLLLYAGEDRELVTKLEAAFGPPFAGG